MPKATLQDLLDQGWDAQQFGAPADWSTLDTGYLARVLDIAAQEVEGRVGSTAYAAAAGLELTRLREAERAWCAAELWRRRAPFLERDAVRGRESPRLSDELRACRDRAQAEQERALALIAQVAGQPQCGGLAQAVVETGPYPALRP